MMMKSQFTIHSHTHSVHIIPEILTRNSLVGVEAKRLQKEAKVFH